MFELRHTEGMLLPSGKREYEEDFYLNRQHPCFSNSSFLHCFAYGESVWRGKYRLPNQTISDWWSFEYIEEGNINFISNGTRYKGYPGNLIILRPGEKIFLRTGSCGFVRKRCIMILKSPMLDYLLGNGSLAGINFIQNSNSSKVAEIYLQIKKAILEKSENTQQNVGVLLYALLVELEQLTVPQIYPEPLYRALNIINAFPEYDYSLDMLSRECKISSRTLSRLFQLHLHISPINYIIKRRLELAKLLISINNMPLKEVAEKCGYKSESFFSRSFKKQHGLPPAKFRQK